MLRAVFWFSPPYYDYTVVDAPNDAIAWCLHSLREKAPQVELPDLTDLLESVAARRSA